MKAQGSEGACPGPHNWQRVKSRFLPPCHLKLLGTRQSFPRHVGALGAQEGKRQRCWEQSGKAGPGLGVERACIVQRARPEEGFGGWAMHALLEDQ